MGWSAAGGNKDDLETEAFLICGETEITKVIKPGGKKAQKESKRTDTDGKQ